MRLSSINGLIESSERANGETATCSRFPVSLIFCWFLLITISEIVGGSCSAKPQTLRNSASTMFMKQRPAKPWTDSFTSNKLRTSARTWSPTWKQIYLRFKVWWYIYTLRSEYCSSHAPRLENLASNALPPTLDPMPLWNACLGIMSWYSKRRRRAGDLHLRSVIDISIIVASPGDYSQDCSCEGLFGISILPLYITSPTFLPCGSETQRASCNAP